VLLPTPSEDEDVVQINNHKIAGEVMQDVIHQPRKSSKGICKPKGHEQPFKEAFLGF